MLTLEFRYFLQKRLIPYISFLRNPKSPLQLSPEWLSSERCCVETIIDAPVDLTSPALKTRLAATGSALAAAKSEREEAAKRRKPSTAIF